MQFILRTKEQRIKPGHKLLDLPSKLCLNAFVHSVLVILDTALLLAPVYTLREIESSGTSQLLVIFALTLTFAACCSVFTQARGRQMFAATRLVQCSWSSSVESQR